MVALLFVFNFFFAAKQWACKVCRGNYTVHNKSLSPVSKEIGILASHSQDIPVVASAFAHTKSSDGLLDVVNKSFGLHLRIEL